MSTVSIGAAGAVLAAALVLPLGTAAAETEQEIQQKPEAPAEITTGMLSESITRYSPVITQYGAEESVEQLGEGGSEEENVIVVETDILFRSYEWEPPSGAGAEIGELVQEIPEGASVEV